MRRRWFLQADSEHELLASVDKAIAQTLEGFIGMCYKSYVISIEQLPDEHCPHLGLLAQSCQVKQLPILTWCANRCCQWTSQRCRTGAGKRRSRKGSAPLLMVKQLEEDPSYRTVPFISASMEGDHHATQFWGRQPIFLRSSNRPFLSADQIKGLDEIYEHHVERPTLHSALLLELVEREDHVGCRPTCSEAALGFRVDEMRV